MYSLRIPEFIFRLLSAIAFSNWEEGLAQESCLFLVGFMILRLASFSYLWNYYDMIWAAMCDFGVGLGAGGSKIYFETITVVRLKCQKFIWIAGYSETVERSITRWKNLELLVGCMYESAIGIVLFIHLSSWTIFLIAKRKNAFNTHGALKAKLTFFVRTADSSIEIVNAAYLFHIILDSIQSSGLGIRASMSTCDCSVYAIHATITDIRNSWVSNQCAESARQMKL